MKKTISHVLNNTMSKETLSSLTTIVRETLAFNLVENKNSITPAQLWDIQRRKKPIVLRRFY